MNASRVASFARDCPECSLINEGNGSCAREV